MYEELVKKLRDDNACLSVSTLHEAADAIEALSAYARQIADLKQEASGHGKCLVGYTPTTNADRIRAMSDEGIEDWYWWMHKEMMRYTDSRIFVHEWLKAPVEVQG